MWGLRFRSRKRARLRALAQQAGGQPKVSVCMYSAQSSCQSKPHQLKCLVSVLTCGESNIFAAAQNKSICCSGRHGLSTSVMILFRSFAILLGALLPMVYNKPANPWGTRYAAALQVMQKFWYLISQIIKLQKWVLATQSNLKMGFVGVVCWSCAACAASHQ